MESSALNRAQRVLGHVQASSIPQGNIVATTVAAKNKADDDVVIVYAQRTAIGKSGRGSFKDTHWTDLLVPVLKSAVEKSGVNPKDIEDVQVGTVLAAGGGATQARMASLAAGIPETAALATTNRQCSSGLQAFANIAGAIKTGTIKVGIAAGVESMSTHNMADGIGNLNTNLTKNGGAAADCLIPMGITSENVAAKYGLSRKEQDEFAVLSNQKAAAAQKNGLFKDEIIPITVQVKDKDGNEKTVTVSQDEGIRADTTFEGLSKLKPAFKQGGSTTAGNSSQTSDGAAVVVAMTRAEAKKRGLPILGRFLSYAVVGVPPNIMGVGPRYAIPAAVEKAGLSLGDIDQFEINEAFASQALWSVKELKIPMEKVNPLGGAIALGHPLGCTGARQIATLLHHLRRTKKRFGVVSMCIGTGQGAAGVFEAE
jgi:acetyl-CoA acyltransferase 1